MVEVYHLQKRHPDAGRFRLWSLLARDDISVRTVGRVIALNKQVYDDIPQVARQRRKKPPQPHPYKASYPHQYWFIDGHQMDFALEGVKWWSRIVLDGYSRTMLAGAVAPVEAGWVTLMVLYTACLRYGVPAHLVSDSGGAFTSHDVTAVLQRLQIEPKPLLSTQGESYKNLMETHFNIQRRLYDYQFSLTTTPVEFEQAHQAFMTTYNTTAHEGLLKDGFHPPIPLQVLREAKGGAIPRRSYHGGFLAPCFPAPRTNMAVSPCTATTSMQSPRPPDHVSWRPHQAATQQREDGRTSLQRPFWPGGLRVSGRTARGGGRAQRRHDRSVHRHGARHRAGR
jgi:hypothetical protein